MVKLSPKKPIKVGLVKPLLMFILEIFLWSILIISAINILSYYIYCILNHGWFNKETIKIAIYLLIGSYYFLIIDKKKIYEMFGIKLNLPFASLNKNG